MSEQPEKLPVDEVIKVIDYRTIYKTKTWWCAVLLGNMYGHDKIMVYQWKWDERKNDWKRQQKFTINFEKDWILIKEAVDQFLPKIKVIS